MTDMVDLIGVKADGTQDNLGKVKMPWRMKAKEIAREMFGGDPNEEWSEAASCFDAMCCLVEWMEKQNEQDPETRS